jgi:hypothetical protein
VTICGLLFSLIYAMRRPKPAPLREVATATVERRTIRMRYCGRFHLLSGEPVAHACKMLPADALTAEVDGRFLIAARILARNAARQPLMAHPGIWKVRQR